MPDPTGPAPGAPFVVKTGGAVLFSALRVLLCCLLLLAPLYGCAEKAGPDPVRPRPAAPSGTYPEPRAVAPAAHPAEAGAEHGTAQQAQAQAGTGFAASSKDAAKAAPRSSSVYERMLRSAGRDPASPQPEAGFTLTVPGRVGDGEAFLVEFGAEGVREARVRWRGKSIRLDPAGGPRPGVGQVLLPVPLDEKAASLPLALDVTWQDGRSETFEASLPVRRRAYAVRKLTVDGKFLSPSPEMQEKIKRDRAEMRAALATRSESQMWSLPLQRPVPGRVTSGYGRRSVFNGVPKSPHRGTDFDGNDGDPIVSVERGIVVLAADHYYSGNVVVVDHGTGVLSIYMHLSGFNVSPGQRVARGEVIGFMGKTGRVTGTHLHLGLSVQGVSVNAEPLLSGS